MRLRWLLLLIYLPLAHWAVVSGSQALTACALILLCTVALYRPLTEDRAGAWWTLTGCATVAGLLAAAGDGLWLMVALSLALPGVVLIGFLRSLQAGQTPLITAIANRMQGPLPASLQIYTRQLTTFWAAMIAILMTIELALILFATPTDWSRYANGYAYPILGAIFAIEYGYRRWRYRHLPQPDLNRYLRGLLSLPALQTGRQT